MVLSSVLKPDQSTRIFRKSLIIQSLHKDPVRTIQFSSHGLARSRTVSHGLARSCTVLHGLAQSRTVSPALTREHSASLKITRPDSTQRQSSVDKQPQRHRITGNAAVAVKYKNPIVPKTATTQPTAASRQNGLSARGRSLR